jgi:MFS superfamily sulfate permease-like transporter
MSAIVHGMLLVGSVIFIPQLMNHIPLAALAAILLMVGYKLASPEKIKQVFNQGYDQYVPFTITILTIIFEDLLIGIFVGTFTGLLFVVFTNFRSVISVINEGNTILIKFNKDVSFLNKPRIKQILMTLKEGDEVYIDGSKANFIDHDIFNLLYEFKKGAKDKKITVEFNRVNRKIQGDINQYDADIDSAH